MPDSPHWNSCLATLLAAGIILGSHAAQAQFATERKQLLPPPGSSAEVTDPAASALPPEDKPVSLQPFGTATQLPKGYKPSHSALDPAKPDPNNPSTSPLPPSYQQGEGEGLPSETNGGGIEAGPPPPTIITAQPDPRTYIAVELQGLDKVTARRQQFKATMGTVTSFGNLEIVPRACWRSPAEAQPDSAALLEIWQWKPGEKPSFVFFGWMFASSPGLSSLEHPIYDVTVLKCVQDPDEAKAEAKKEKAAAAAAIKEKTADAPTEDKKATAPATTAPLVEGTSDPNAPQPD